MLLGGTPAVGGRGAFSQKPKSISSSLSERVKVGCSGGGAPKTTIMTTINNDTTTTTIIMITTKLLISTPARYW